MTLKHAQEYRDPEIFKQIVDGINQVIKKEVYLMEVCGTHTMSIFRNGLRTVLPDTITLISGPGCPVCVTAQKEIDAFIELSTLDDIILTTFGDLLRVPGKASSLEKERANGSDIRVVYSTIDALEIARKNPDKKVIFLAVGFETTAPTTAASIIYAEKRRINNYYVFSAHKLIPPALVSLMEVKNVHIDGFILPGHVSVILGIKAYVPFLEHYHVPCVIAGFEPVDIIHAIFKLVSQIQSGRVKLENCYRRSVTYDGNQKAKKIIQDVFETVDSTWRGIGTIAKSGLKFREKFASFDAQKMFEFTVPDSEDPKGCSCGEILTGLKIPPECLLYKKVCTPMKPVGPCMVSSEGTCAAYYKYHANSSTRGCIQ
jgi:hydrogenase expression/formation protein HypD